MIRCKKIISLVYMIFLVIIIGSSLISIGLNRSGYGPYQFKTVLSGSMEPNISVGSLVVVKKAVLKELKVDDIISFSANGQVITHRIIFIENTGDIITKGDANNYEDGIYEKEIIGKVLVSIPKVGYFFRLLQSISGKIALVSSVLNIVLLEHFIGLILIEMKEKKKELEKDEKKQVIE